MREHNKYHTHPARSMHCTEVDEEDLLDGTVEQRALRTCLL